jgi:predicted amidohydrolase
MAAPSPAPRAAGKLTVALVSEVYPDEHGPGRLARRLTEAAQRGADLAVLPELPLNAWRPSRKEPRDDDAEGMDGARARAQSEAARAAGVALVGGIIHRDAATGRRTNRALVFDRRGTLVATYDKLHLPCEPGFWETSHYEPGASAPRAVDALGVPFGVQLCSDITRPQGCQLLGAQGAVAVVAPRATEARTFERWRAVFRANALTSCAYILSVNRPGPEDGVGLGGPSVAFDPNGEVLVETTETLALVTVESAVVRRAAGEYPGYLPVRAGLYADAWAEIAGRADA